MVYWELNLDWLCVRGTPHALDYPAQPTVCLGKDAPHLEEANREEMSVCVCFCLSVLDAWFNS